MTVVRYDDIMKIIYQHKKKLSSKLKRKGEKKKWME